jgi:hypothetical protein
MGKGAVEETLQQALFGIMPQHTAFPAYETDEADSDGEFPYTEPFSMQM